MGCDIHMYVERKTSRGWFNCDYFVPNVNYKEPTCVNSARYFKDESSKYQHVPIYDGRNYALFATLADVRNYGNTAYISEPKGFPEDACDYIKDQYESWYGDAHSASYLTLQELIDFHKAGYPLKRRGMLSPEQLEDFDNGVLPDHWCQGTNIYGYEFREWEEENDVLVPLIEKLKDRADELYMIYKFYWDSNDEHCRESAYKAAADIRIVFWFDN